MEIQLSDHFTYKRIMRFCTPPILMMVFTSIYGVVDGLFVSNFVGKIPFAAINLVMPFIMILGGFSFMIGTGGSALVALTLGMGQKEKANRYFSMMVIFTVISGLVLSAFGIIFMEPISRLLGATDAMLSDCVLYGRVVLSFNTFFMLQSVFQTFVAVAEKPKLGLFATVAAGITNMALDAVFVAVFHWGIAGAALATGISQCSGTGIPLVYFLRPNDSLLRLTKTSLQASILLKTCAIGASELMSNISSSLVSVLYNYQLLRFSGENGVAAYGVLMYIQFIFIAVFLGYTLGTAPVVGYHYGAGNSDELKNVLKKSLLLTFLSGSFMMVLAQVLALPLAALFVGYDAELLELTRYAFQVFSFSFVLAGINIFASSFFTALNNGAISAAISFLRTLVFQMASVLILPAIWGLDGIWWAITVGEVLACAGSGAFLAAKKEKYHYL